MAVEIDDLPPVIIALMRSRSKDNFNRAIPGTTRLKLIILYGQKDSRKGNLFRVALPWQLHENAYVSLACFDAPCDRRQGLRSLIYASPRAESNLL